MLRLHAGQPVEPQLRTDGAAANHGDGILLMQEYSFRAEEWERRTISEQMCRCRLLAQQARHLSTRCSPEVQPAIKTLPQHGIRSQLLLRARSGAACYSRFIAPVSHAKTDICRHESGALDFEFFTSCTGRMTGM